MRFLFWRLERVASTHAQQTRVCIDLKRDPQGYVYQWTVADKKAKRLSKRELHELDMRVAKYVETLTQNNPVRWERRSYFAKL